MFWAISDFRVTLKSIPICSSIPDLSLGRILVPSRLQTSGGIAPAKQRVQVCFSTIVLTSGLWSGIDVGSDCGKGLSVNSGDG